MKLTLPPDQQGYSFAAGSTNISTELDGGAARYRTDKLGAAMKFPVQWTLSKKNYNFLMAFYRTQLNYGVLPFTIDLILDSGDLQTYTCHFVPDTFGLTSQVGATYVIGATLEVIPDPTYAAGDAAIITAGPDV